MTQKPEGEGEPGSCCVACGKVFRCGAAAGDATCWCALLPHDLPPDPAIRGCYCPECLRERLAAHGQGPA